MAKRKDTKKTEQSASASRDRIVKLKASARKLNRRLASAASDTAGSGNNGFGPSSLPSSLPKTQLTPAELEAFKGRLLEKRRQILGDVDSMESEALGKNRSSAAGDLSMMPIHMADIGTDNYEQEFAIGLIESERETLKEIDAALRRIADSTYGICLKTHKPISKARLRAKPWAQYCIEYKRAQEHSERRKI